MERNRTGMHCSNDRKVVAFLLGYPAYNRIRARAVAVAKARICSKLKAFRDDAEAAEEEVEDSMDSI